MSFSANSSTDSVSVRRHMCDALRIDLLGPRPEDAALQRERLPQAPSRWYLTGFLVPADTPEEQRAQDSEEALDEPAEPVHGGDDSGTPDRGSHKRLFLPSSIGLSILAAQETRRLEVAVSWGDYAPDAEVREMAQESGAGREEDDAPGNRRSRRFAPWVRRPGAGVVAIDLDAVAPDRPHPLKLADSGGLVVVCLVRPTRVRTLDGLRDVRAISLFTVNRRTPAPDDEQDVAFAFQVEMRVDADRPLIPRRNLAGLESTDWDERLSDLHYRDVAEYAVGHNVSTRADVADGACRRVHTEWMPHAGVPRMDPSAIDAVEFGMETLGDLDDGSAAKAHLEPLVEQYRDWIAGQRQDAAAFDGRRREVADELVRKASSAADRIQAGIDLLAEPDVLDAFRIANRAMAAAARRRRALEERKQSQDVAAPEWRPFQLAYVLMNLRGIAEPTHSERDVVDLLFFPTGGGKTEAYFGLSAFTLVLRRLRHPGAESRGLSVLMRYTLRLLTLDQLGRAAALICALELERERAPERLGEWPFEIALWVGRAATPNYMGRKGDTGDKSARVKTLRYARDSSREPPLPIEQCPWCGKPFRKQSFRLHPNTNEPTDLLVYCVNRRCDFSRKRHLPIVAVDEPIYQRRPAFMIATADKFAALPWTGETARFFHGGDPDHPRPPDLIIQDELHLISGPLGTMAGLYETAIDRLCTRRVGDENVRPKVIASTATVRMAQKQIQALFDRRQVAVFPAPGLDRRNSFFAREASESPDDVRLYVGVAAQGRGPRVVFLRSMITLMAAAQAAWEAAAGAGTDPNPADSYMTAVAYFNALRELGSARRIVEDEIGARLVSYAERKRLGETAGLFANRQIAFEPVELTSRVATANVADAKRRLALDFTTDQRIDVALATNMISVGLDVSRLGLMLVAGQPKTASEYIQATSRVGRDPTRPGLVVTLLNVHKPRDRSHYERFPAFHESFYRNVEATSVTPFSSRALDRGLPAVAVALARLGIPGLTPNPAARRVDAHHSATDAIARAVGDRARRHADGLPAGVEQTVQGRVRSLFDDWAALAHEAGQVGVTFGYARGRSENVSTPLLREMIDPDRETLNDRQLRFRAPRSLRDVEPGTLLGIKTPEGRNVNK